MEAVVVQPGDRYGKLIVIKEIERSEHGYRRFMLHCDCGNDSIKFLRDIRSKRTQSCGCYRKERGRAALTTHGLSKRDSKPVKLYCIWNGMKQRCLKPYSTAYHRYGGRGIKICDEWLDYPAFYKWAMENGYQEGLSIERVNNDGNYEPSNCKWIPLLDQRNNNSRSVLITYKGETKTLKQWSLIIGLDQRTIHQRIKSGWPIEDCLDLYKYNAFEHKRKTDGNQSDQ